MRLTRWNAWRAVLAAAGLAVAAAAAPATAAASAAGPTGPVVKLEATQPSITVGSFRGTVHMDPGIWVASLGSALQFNVRRASYTKPVTITQIIRMPGGPVRARPLPAGVLDGWNGLRDFIRMTVRDREGKVVASPMLTFCPNTFDPERASPQSPATTPYPQQCGADPFPRSMVWGSRRAGQPTLPRTTPSPRSAPGPSSGSAPGSTG
jgi:hypothetical protein